MYKLPPESARSIIDAEYDKSAEEMLINDPEILEIHLAERSGEITPTEAIKLLNQLMASRAS